jgi:hypothetical protein
MVILESLTTNVFFSLYKRGETCRHMTLINNDSCGLNIDKKEKLNLRELHVCLAAQSPEVAETPLKPLHPNLMNAGWIHLKSWGCRL